MPHFKLILEGIEVTDEMIEKWNNYQWMAYEMYQTHELDVETIKLVPVREFEIRNEYPEGDRQPSDYEGGK